VSNTDHRSVGELLLAAELMARQALANAGNQDAAAMLRAWPEVVQAAGELWRALPDQRVPQALTARVGPQGDSTMVRLEQMATGMHRTMRGHTWPGAGPGDDRLGQIADDLGRAAGLVRGHSAAQVLRSAPVQADLDSAKARVVHSLYLASHAVQVAVGTYRDQVRADYANRRLVPPGNSLHVARAAHDRLAAFEQVAGSFVSRTYPGALAGEHRDLPDSGRLAQALAAWDVQAHRTLTAGPVAANVALVAYTQAIIATHGHVLVRAAADAGHADPIDVEQRLSPPFERAQARWSASAGLWRTLTPPAQEVAYDPALLVASQEVRAALLELVHDRTGPAGLEVIAARVDLAVVVGDVQRALSTGVDLAYVIGAVAADPQVLGAARAVNALSLQVSGADVERIGSSTETTATAWVRPPDLSENRAVPFTDPVRAVCRADAAATVAAARAAMNGATVLDPRPTAAGASSAQVSPGAVATPRYLPPHARAPAPPTGSPRPR